MVKILIGCRYCVRHFEQKHFEILLAGQVMLQNEQNFKIVCNHCIRDHELLKVFLRIQRNAYLHNLCVRHLNENILKCLYSGHVKQYLQNPSLRF